MPPKTGDTYIDAGLSATGDPMVARLAAPQTGCDGRRPHTPSQGQKKPDRGCSVHARTHPIPVDPPGNPSNPRAAHASSSHAHTPPLHLRANPYTLPTSRAPAAAAVAGSNLHTTREHLCSTSVWAGRILLARSLARSCDQGALRLAYCCPCPAQHPPPMFPASAIRAHGLTAA